MLTLKSEGVVEAVLLTRADAIPGWEVLQVDSAKLFDQHIHSWIQSRNNCDKMGEMAHELLNFWCWNERHWPGTIQKTATRLGLNRSARSLAIFSGWRGGFQKAAF